MKKISSRRLYFLFVHYGLKGDLNNENVRTNLQADMKYLNQILEPGERDEWEGRAFVFIDRGFPALVRDQDNIAAGIALGAKLQRFLTSIEYDFALGGIDGMPHDSVFIDTHQLYELASNELKRRDDK